MKNQNDLIFSIVAVVVLLIVAGVTFFTKPVPVQPAPPEAVNTSKPEKPSAVATVFVDALPTSSNSTGGGGAAGGMMAPPGGNGGAPGGRQYGKQPK
jgi:hypothetical protein